MELFMDYDSDEFEVIETCISVLKYTITHTIRYTDGLGGDPDASLSILEDTVHISSHCGLARPIAKIGVRRVYLHWDH